MYLPDRTLEVDSGPIKARCFCNGYNLIAYTLHEKGLITNPASKAKSVGMTEEGFKKLESLFEKIL